MKLKSSSEVLKKLIEDTTNNKIDWIVSIDSLLVKASFEQELTPNKKLNFKIIYYIEHPKSTTLHIYFNKKDTWGSISKSVLDIGGSKRRNESNEISKLLRDILLKEEKLQKNIEIELDDEFKIGDRIIVIKEQDFRKEEIVGQKGTIINQFNKNGLKFLVEFDKNFNYLLINSDFNYDENNSKVVDGKCWIMDPNNIRKINDKK